MIMAFKSVGVPIYYVMFKIFLSSAMINKCHTIRLGNYVLPKYQKEPNTYVTKSSQKYQKLSTYYITKDGFPTT